MAFQVVAKLDDISDGGVKGVNVSGKEIALFRLGNDVFALSDICKHDACVISENHDIQGDKVECTCHGSQYEIKTGKVVNPPAFEDLEKYEVKVEGEDILIEA